MDNIILPIVLLLRGAIRCAQKIDADGAHAEAFCFAMVALQFCSDETIASRPPQPALIKMTSSATFSLWTYHVNGVLACIADKKVFKLS